MYGDNEPHRTTRPAEGRKADPQTDPQDIVAELDAELALIEQLPYRVPLHALAQRARDEIVALRGMVEKQRFVLSKGHAEVRAEALEQAALVVEDHIRPEDAAEVAAAIRALKG